MILSGWTIYSEGFFSFPLSIHRIAVNSWVRVVILQNEGAYGGGQNAIATLSPSPTHPPSRRGTMRLHVRWRRKGPRRRPSFDRRSNGPDPGAMADLQHMPRPRPSSKKKKERTNERGTEGTDREKRGGHSIFEEGG